MRSEDRASALNKKLIGAADIATALSTSDDTWTTRRAQRWLENSGAGVKRCGRWITTLARLRDHFPEAYDAVLESLPDDAFDAMEDDVA